MRFTIPSAVVLAVVGLAPEMKALAQPPAEKPLVSRKILVLITPVEIEPNDSDLERKLKERHNEAAKLLETRVLEYKKGDRDIGLMFEAAQLAAEAKLELATNAKAKTAALQQRLELAQAIEDYWRRQMESGLALQGDYQRARLSRLTAEIELLKAKR